MSKQFNVPPVVFPTGGGTTPPTSSSDQRLTAPFQPQRASNPIPFMSFDMGTASFSTPITAATTSTIGGGGIGYANFEDEPPLLEELGINTRQIWGKTISILNPFRVNSDLHEDADLSGPFLFLFAFGLFQLLAGKIHFGIILGWVTVASLYLYVVFNMLAGRNGTLDLYRCLSLVGYCMLPMVMLSAISLFLPQAGVVICVIAAVFIIWSTRVCTKLLVEVARWDDHRGLVSYACFLIFMMFSLLVIF